MANPKGNLKNLTGTGRPKGKLNKFTELKNDALKAFHKIGGMEALAEWGRKPQNRAAFYKILFSLVPKDVKIEGSVTHSYDPATIQELGSLLREARGIEPGIVGETAKGVNEDGFILPH